MKYTLTHTIYEHIDVTHYVRHVVKSSENTEIIENYNWCCPTIDEENIPYLGKYIYVTNLHQALKDFQRKNSFWGKCNSVFTYFHKNHVESL